MGAGLVQILETLFRKHFWVVNLFIIFLIALFLALGLSHLLSARLAPYTVIHPRTTPATSPEQGGRGDDQSLIISELLNRGTGEETGDEQTPQCTRDEDCEPPLVCQDGTCVEAEPGDEEMTPSGGDCLSSDIAAALIGTMASRNDVWSFGLVSDQTTNRTVLVRAGDEIAGATVTRVERNRVYILNEGREECLKAGEAPATSRPIASRDTSASSRRSSTSRSSRTQETSRSSTPASSDEDRQSSYRTINLREGVRRVSPTNYEIDRTAIDAALEDPRSLQSQAPEFEQNYDDNRRPDGIRLTSIPPGSIFTALGVRPNDVITGVNGRGVTTPQRAMDVYQALQNESHIELTVLRRGRQRTLIYDIR